MNCPNCHRILYSRQRPCEHCGEPLPEDLRLPDHEIAKMKEETAEFEARLAKLRAEAEETYQASLRHHQVFPPPDGGIIDL